MFAGVKLAKNADPGKYEYSGYGTSLHVDIKKKYILILGIGPTERLDNTMLYRTLLQKWGMYMDKSMLYF